MSETELRGALVAALSPLWRAQGRASVLDNPGLHNDLALAEAKLQAILASIPAEPEQADEVAGLDVETLAQVLAVLDGAPGFSPAFVTNAQTVLALRIAAAYPLAVEYRARLAPARDDGGAS